MTVNAMLTVARHAETASEKANQTDHVMKMAYELGWTQSAFAGVLNQIEIQYGEDALLKILDRVCIMPIYSSSI